MRHYALWFGLSAFTSSTASPIAFFSTDSITSEQTIDNSIPSSDVFPVVATETTDETQSDEADAFIDNYNVPDSGRNKDWIIAGAGAEKLTTNEDLQAVSDAWTEIIWRITRNNVKPGTLSPGVVKDYDKLKQRLRDKPKEPLTKDDLKDLKDLEERAKEEYPDPAPDEFRKKVTDALQYNVLEDPVVKVGVTGIAITGAILLGALELILLAL